VTKDHIAEIFGAYGKINCVEIVIPEKSSSKVVCRRMIVEYETTSEAHKAIKYMNGGKCCRVSSICKCYNPSGVPTKCTKFAM